MIPAGTKPVVNQQKLQSQGDFASILDQKLGQPSEVKFSRHAEQRLQMRNIHLSPEQQEKLKTAVDRAQSKGIRDSLVLMDDIAMVVNVKNRTVVTAVNSSELKDNVFTNIDGAVFG